MKKSTLITLGLMLVSIAVYCQRVSPQFTYTHVVENFEKKWNNYSEEEKATRFRELKKMERFKWYWEVRIGEDETFEEYFKRKKTSDKPGTNPRSTDFFIPTIKNPPCKNWVSIGNSNMSNGVSNSGGAGRVTAVAFDPEDDNTIYAGAALGGLWKSTDLGQSWHNLNTDFLPNIGVHDIAIPSAYPQVIFISSSSVPHFDGNSHYASKMYATFDGGDNWEDCELPDGAGVIQDIFIGDMGEGGWYVLVSCEGGVFRSDDLGIPGSYVQVFDHNPKWNDGATRIVSTDADEDLLFLCGNFRPEWQLPDEEADVMYKSTNGGQSFGNSPWVTIHKEGNISEDFEIHLGLTPGSDNADSFLIMGTNLIVSQQNPDKMYVLIGLYPTINVNPINDGWVTLNQDVTTHLYRSDDGGETWTNLFFSNPQYRSAIRDPFNLAIDPLDDSKFFLGRATGTSSNIIFHFINNGTAQMSQQGGQIDMHPDVRVLQFQVKPGNRWTPASSRLLVGTDGGVNLTTDVSPNAPIWSNVTGEGMVISQIFRHSSTQTNPNQISAGCLDIGTMARLGTGSNTWDYYAGGDGLTTMISPTDDNLVYYSWLGWDGALNLRRSTNGFGGGGTVNPSGKGQGRFLAPVLISPGNTSRHFAGWDQLYRNDNNGAGVWNLVHSMGDNGSNGPVDKIAVAKSNSDIVLHARRGINQWNTEDRIFLSTNGGSSWSKIQDANDNLWQKSAVSELVIHPENENIFFASFYGSTWTGQVYITKDQGDTWEEWNNGLPNTMVNSMVYDEQANYLYAGTEYGVYRRHINGTTWLKFGMKLPNVTISDLDIQENTHMLRASTFGRGMWQICLSQTAFPMPPNDDPTRKKVIDQFKRSIKISPNPTTGQATVTFDLPENGMVDIAIYSEFGNDELIKVFENYYLLKGERKFKFDASNLRHGNYFVVFMYNGLRITAPFIKL